MNTNFLSFLPRKQALLLLLLFLSCADPVSREVTPAFYHWQSKWEPSSSEYTLLDSLEVKRIYLRFFDLDWNSSSKEVTPLASLKIQTPIPEELSIVPTIFITNRSFIQIKKEDLPTLVEKVANKIRTQIKRTGKKEVEEIQFDCDWTQRTRAVYFRFLDLIKMDFPDQIISATIRLHQIKYPKKTGVPPVDRGMLMFYNMGDVENPETKNAIFDWSIASAYLERLPDYPLDLDLALPIFAWGVLFRDGKLTKLINNLRMEALRDTTRFSPINQSWVELKKSTYLQGYYLYAGDRLRLEAVRPEDLIAAAQHLSKLIANPKINLAYYHLDSSTLKHFSYAHFQKINTALGQE